MACWRLVYFCTSSRQEPGPRTCTEHICRESLCPSHLLSRSAGVGANPSPVRSDPQLRDAEECACKDRAEPPHHCRRCLGQIGVGSAEPDRRGPSETWSLSTETPGEQLS